MERHTTFSYTFVYLRGLEKKKIKNKKIILLIRLQTLEDRTIQNTSDIVALLTEPILFFFLMWGRLNPVNIIHIYLSLPNINGHFSHGNNT